MAKKNGFVSQATIDALLRYRPELDALTTLQRQAASDYGLAVRQAKGTAMATQQAVHAATPQLAKAYDDASSREAGLSSVLSSAVQGLQGPVGDVFRTVAGYDAANSAERVNEAKTSALKDLIDRGVQATQGRGFSIQQAQAKRSSDLAQIGERRQQIAGEMGLYQASELARLLGDQSKLDFTATQNALNRQNQQEIATGHDATSLENAQTRARNRTPQRLAADGTPAQSRSAHSKAVSTIEKVRGIAKSYFSPSHEPTRHQLVDYLTAGRTAGDDGKGHKVGAVASVAPDVYMSAALDLLYDGHLSRETQHRLQDLGYIVHELGLTTYGEWKRKLGGDKPVTPQQWAGVVGL